MNTYHVTVRFRHNGRHRVLDLLAPDSDTLYQKLDFVMAGEPVYDVTSVKLGDDELLVNARGKPITDNERMTLAAKRDQARKEATSILEDWDRPDSWSTGTLRASALYLVNHNKVDNGGAALWDLSIEQRIKLALIASGVEPRPTEAA